MHLKLNRIFYVILVCLAVSHCHSEPDTQTYLIKFTTKANDDRVLNNIPIYIGSKLQGSTNQQGILTLRLEITQHQTLAARAECPSGYKGSQNVTSIRLRRFQSASEKNAEHTLSYDFVCSPTKVLAAVIFSTNIPEELSLISQGHEVGRTNRDGVGHVLIETTPGSELTLLVDTREHPKLRPQYPIRTFYIGNQDDTYVFEQPFDIQKQKRSKRVRKLPSHFPIRIQ